MSSATAVSRRRKWNLLKLLVPLALALSACGAPTPSAPTESSTVRAPAAEEPSTVRNNSDSTETATLDKHLVALGHFLVPRHELLSSVPWTSGVSTFYLPGHGPVELSAASLVPDKDITSEIYTSIGTAEQPLVAGLIEYRQPASGLVPESYINIAVGIDPISSKILSTIEATSSDEGLWNRSIAGSNTNVASFVMNNQNSVVGETRPGTTVGYDMSTGKEVWAEKGVGSSAEGLGAIVTWGHVTGECPVAQGRDVPTGKVLFTVRYSAISAEHCHEVSVNANQLAVVFPGESENEKYFRFQYGNHVAFNAKTGAPATLPEKLVAVDPRSSLVAGLNSEDSGSYSPLDVIDTASGKVVWSLPGDKRRSLKAQVLALYDSTLYLKTTDQVLEVDMATGLSKVSVQDLYPAASVDSWTYWSDGTLKKG